MTNAPASSALSPEDRDPATTMPMRRARRDTVPTEPPPHGQAPRPDPGRAWPPWSPVSSAVRTARRSKPINRDAYRTSLAKALRLGIITVILTACTTEEALTTPRSDVPSPLAGEWFTGTLSTIQYYDRNSGEFSDPNGEGFYYIFDADGGYQTGAVINSTVAGCTMRLLGDEIGTLTVSGSQLTMYRDHVTVSVTNTCGNSGARTQGAETRFMSWSIRVENGLEWLDLRHGDGSVETYRRWSR